MAKSVRKNEIWMVSFNSNSSGITHGFRPALIVSTNYMNTNKDCAIATVIPLTTSSVKGGLPTHVEIEANENLNKLKCNSIALAEQIITVNKENDIKNCLGKISDDEAKKINIALSKALGIIGYNS